MLYIESIVERRPGLTVILRDSTGREPLLGIGSTICAPSAGDVDLIIERRLSEGRLLARADGDNLRVRARVLQAVDGRLNSILPRELDDQIAFAEERIKRATGLEASPSANKLLENLKARKKLPPTAAAPNPRCPYEGGRLLNFGLVWKCSICGTKRGRAYLTDPDGREYTPTQLGKWPWAGDAPLDPDKWPN